MIRCCRVLAFVLVLPLVLANAASAQADETDAPAGLLFRVSGDYGLTADVARGEAEPNFADKVAIKRDRVHGAYIEASDELVLSWHAQRNIYAQRGTLSFYWRPREVVG